MKTIQWLFATAAVSLSLPVFATSSTFTTTYDFTTTAPTAASTGYNPYAGGKDTTVNGYGSQISDDYGNKLVFKAATGSIPGNSTVSVSAYASTGLSIGTNVTSGTVYGSNTSVGIDTGIVTYYSGNGLAVTSANGAVNSYGTSAEFSNCSISNAGKGSGSGCSDTVPEHATDNKGAYEALLLAFNGKVKLTSLTIGFPTGANPDSDATVLYYTGSGVPPVVTNYSFASLVSSGLWAVDNGSLFNLGTAVGQTGYITTPAASQYFLIGAYIPLTGETSSGDTSPDYIKLKGISTTQVPEPSSVALFGIAGGALFIRRRRSARAV